jgi:hypothetical protein
MWFGTQWVRGVRRLRRRRWRVMRTRTGRRMGSSQRLVPKTRHACTSYSSMHGSLHQPEMHAWVPSLHALQLLSRPFLVSGQPTPSPFLLRASSTTNNSLVSTKTDFDPQLVAAIIRDLWDITLQSGEDVEVQVRRRPRLITSSSDLKDSSCHALEQLCFAVVKQHDVRPPQTRPSLEPHRAGPHVRGPGALPAPLPARQAAGGRAGAAVAPAVRRAAGAVRRRGAAGDEGWVGCGRVGRFSAGRCDVRSPLPVEVT